MKSLTFPNRCLTLFWKSGLCSEKARSFSLSRQFSDISRSSWAVISSRGSSRRLTTPSGLPSTVTSPSSSSWAVMAVINSSGVKSINQPVNQSRIKFLIINLKGSLHNVRFYAAEGKEKREKQSSMDKKDASKPGGAKGAMTNLGVSGVVAGVVLAFYVYARNKKEVVAKERMKAMGTEAPTTSYSRHRYMEYTPGTTNLIISVPHDGFLHPASIPDRVDGCRDRLGGLCHFPLRLDCPSKGPNTDEWYCRATTYSDTFTQEIGRGLVEELTRLTGTRPYLVVNNLHRSKMDPNRDINRAAHGNTDGEDAYNDFHQFIEQAEAALGGPGLLIDLHGHTHPHEKVEIGYNYQPKDINAGDFTKDVSSMNALMVRTGMSPADLLAGDHSLGAMFEKEGYNTIPSPRQPVPGEDKYFRGGYTTRNHGSKDGGVVDALQIEVPRGIREGPQQGKDDFTKALAKVIAEFHEHHYTV